MEVIWLMGSYGLGLGAAQMRLPPLVGYLAAGLALSALGLGGVGTDLLREIGHLGVLFLLFTVGLHLRFRNLLRSEVLGAGGLHLAVSAGLFGAVALAAGLGPGAGVVLGVALAFSSTVLAAKALEERDALAAYHGRIAVGVLVLQDVVAVALLAWLGAGTPSMWAALLLLLPAARPALLRLLRLTGHDELMLLFGLLLALGGAALFSAVGLSSELGALAAGVLLAGDPRSDELSEKLWALKEAFLVGFFLQVGLTGLPDLRGWAIVALLLVLLPVKSVLFFGLFVLFRLRARTAYMAAASLSSYSEFTLIAAATAAAAGLIPGPLVVVLAIAAAGSFAANALLNRFANPIYERLEARLVRFERSGDHPDAQPRSLGSAQVLVVGMGRVGAAAYEALRGRGVRAVGLDADPGKIQRHLSHGRRVIYGDASDPELWSELDPGNLTAVIMAIADVEAAASAAQALRRRGFVGVINALSTRREEDERLRDAGVTTICHPLVQAGVQLAESSVRREAA